MSQSLAEAFESVIQLPIRVVEAQRVALESRWPGYPMPLLRLDERETVRDFHAVILENAFLKVTFLLELGGRIAAILDKRTSVQILPEFGMVTPVEGGSRGVTLPLGIRLTLDGSARLTDLSPVSYHIEGDEEAAAIWLSETFTGSDLSYHVRWSLPNDQAVLKAEFRILNRSLTATPYNGGLLLDGTTVSLTRFGFEDADRKVGLAVLAEPGILEGRSNEDGLARTTRFAEKHLLGPRQVDTFSLDLIPYSGLSAVSGVSTAAALSIFPGSIRIQSTERLDKHKLVIRTPSGETLEAPIEVYPENILDMRLGDLEPVAVAILDAGKNERLRVEVGSVPEGATTVRIPPLPISIGPDSDMRSLRRACTDLHQRHLAHLLIGYRLLSERKFAEAASSIEQSLLYNADDPLAWWAKGVALRLADSDNEAELLNAHYLAPLEPALRVESFLSQPIDLNADPNPLLGSLAEVPEEFVEGVCLLIEMSLYDQASRLIDEALRHLEVPMLRYLMAYCLLKGTRLGAEASEQIRLAGEAPLGPPYPFRSVEVRAIRLLAATFPQDSRLSRLHNLVDGL